MGNTKRAVLAVVFAVIVQAGAPAAGQLPPGTERGNPTPGVEQPAPPVVADRITVIGCVSRIGAAPSPQSIHSWRHSSASAWSCPGKSSTRRREPGPPCASSSCRSSQATVDSKTAGRSARLPLTASHEVGRGGDGEGLVKLNHRRLREYHAE
jgi:hypothetical protein